MTLEIPRETLSSFSRDFSKAICNDENGENIAVNLANVKIQFSGNHLRNQFMIIFIRTLFT
jgi:hypothetical protein